MTKVATSVDESALLSSEDRDTLLKVAAQGLVYAVKHRYPMRVTLSDYSQVLRAERASFVTLHLEGKLRGCVGSLRPLRPLVADVAFNVYAAANEDSRFEMVEEKEIPDIKIHISVLTVPEKITFRTEAELIGLIRPGVDGLIIADKANVGTFLPIMWEQIPDAEEFLRQLKNKAGLAFDYWSPSIEVFRYTAEYFGES